MPDASWEAVASCVCGAICYSLQGLGGHVQLLAALPAVHIATLATYKPGRTCMQGDMAV